MKSAFEENRQNAMKIISYASVTIKEKGPLAPSRRDNCVYHSNQWIGKCISLCHGRTTTEYLN
uniref:Uncharacterized protein n=1 Tax=Magallana gigas TaxID=29159 RepID=K1RHD9_MAGGI